jgi:hypothetical protein
LDVANTLLLKENCRHLEVDGGITLKRQGGKDWVNLATVRVQWRTLPNTVMKCLVPQDGKFLGHLGDHHLLKDSTA